MWSEFSNSDSEGEREQGVEWELNFHTSGEPFTELLLTVTLWRYFDELLNVIYAVFLLLFNQKYVSGFCTVKSVLNTQF